MAKYKTPEEEIDALAGPSADDRKRSLARKMARRRKRKLRDDPMADMRQFLDKTLKD